jgi:hypothetical protein
MMYVALVDTNRILFHDRRSPLPQDRTSDVCKRGAIEFETLRPLCMLLRCQMELLCSLHELH